MSAILSPAAKRIFVIICFILILLTFTRWGFWVGISDSTSENEMSSSGYEELSAESIFDGSHVITDQSDPQLLQFIRRHHLFPPSSEPYNLVSPSADPTAADGQEWKIVQSYLGNKTKGFFIECGANDGEFLSNTLVLERDFGWNGLLIESDPIPLVPLFKKQRKAWVSNACLSTKPHPEMVTMKRLDYGSFGGGMAEYGWSLVPAWDQKNNNRTFTVKCFPFFSIMSALNIFEVDFFALDVEMAELAILKTIPFDKIFIKIFAIEIHYPLTKEVIPFMISKGYKCVQHIAIAHTLDYIFVHERHLTASAIPAAQIGTCPPIQP